MTYNLQDLDFYVTDDKNLVKWEDLSEIKKAEFVKYLLIKQERIENENAYLRRLNIAQATKADSMKPKYED